MADLHDVIHYCQNVIISILKDASPDCYILLSKDRVDENSILKIPELADKHLSIEFSDIVKYSSNLLKDAVDKLCMEYSEYAVRIGKFHGYRYKVHEIDTESLAPEALEKAAYRFKPLEGSTKESRIVSFRAYVGLWVKQNIQKTCQAKKEILSLNDQRFDTTEDMLSVLTENDSLWGQKSVLNDPESLEELRALYCPDLSTDELIELINTY